MLLELPHTAGCFVCGRENPHGLGLASIVDTETGQVSTTFSPQPYHIGFENIIHGGILATIVDEIMVWSSIWASRRACVAGEMSMRFQQKAEPGMILTATAEVTRNRSRLIEASSTVLAGDTVICTATAKYIPLGSDQTTAFYQTLISEPQTEQSINILTQTR